MTGRTTRRTKLAAAIVVTALLGSGAAGCGGSASADDGDAITVMTWAAMDSRAGSEPGMPALAQAVAKYFDDNGGVAGHPVRVITCDEHGTRDGAIACANQAASEQVVAVVGSSSQFGDQFMPILESAGISYVGGSGASAAEFTSPYSYPVNGGYQTLLVGNGEQLATAGCRRIAIVRPDTAVGDSMFTDLSNGLAAYNLTAVDVKAAAGRTNYENEIAAAVGPDRAHNCVTSAMDAASTQTLFDGWRRLSPHARLSALIGSFQQSLVDSMGGADSTLEGALATGWYPPDGSPVWNQLHAVMKKYAFTDNSINASDPGVETTWVAYEVFKKVVDRIQGPITAMTVHAAFDATGPVDTGGATPPLAWQDPNLVALQSAPRTVNTFVSFQQVRNGVLTESRSGLVNVAAALTR
ncbi:ABC transporter substrate-binding protein [Streptacidiphilus rugosus]|uniref:ABC transporter substrate-binding protein n=1 Tax=Streptacidiphilus rugosus TaxID=405783 RepID=UPI000566BE66|nr:ABC transporter substrate-binding protein [Streptacidiphilus rugosus]